MYTLKESNRLKKIFLILNFKFLRFFAKFPFGNSTVHRMTCLFREREKERWEKERKKERNREREREREGEFMCLRFLRGANKLKVTTHDFK